MKVIEIDDYLEQHPGLHWVRRESFALLDRMVEAAPGFGWPPTREVLARQSRGREEVVFGSWEKEFQRIVLSDRHHGRR